MTPVPSSAEGEATTLSGDLRVDGTADLQPLPAPGTTAVSDGGYDVRLDAGDSRPGEETVLRFTITEDGAPIKAEPDLGAGGHLVALREGDLVPARPPHRPRLRRVRGDVPNDGRHRLSLQFQHEGGVPDRRLHPRGALTP
jgi:hypothetical protein